MQFFIPNVKFKWKLLALIAIFFSSVAFPRLSAQCDLNCRTGLNIFIGDDCEVEITPTLMVSSVSDSSNCSLMPDDFSVRVSMLPQGNPIANNPSVTRELLDLLLYATVTHIPTGKNCTGTITVEEKNPPKLTCPNDTLVDCGSPTDTATLGVATYIDCFEVDLSVTDITADMRGDCGGVARTITRTFRANASDGKASSCQQKIEIKAQSYLDVDFPADIGGSSSDPLSCKDFDLGFEATGEPSVNGFPISTYNGLCGLTVSYKDRRVEDCGSGFIIFRSWTVLDHCNSQVIRDEQVIQVGDIDPPVIDCPDTLTVSTNSLFACEANALLPTVNITDECSSIASVRMIGPSGIVNGNGGTVPSLPLGFSKVTYLALDECGLEGSCETVVEVLDKTGPNMACEDEITVILSDLGVANVNAGMMVISSEDDCCSTSTSLRLRRMNSGSTDFVTSVRLTCADLSEDIMMINQATDCFGNESICMVPVVLIGAVLDDVTGIDCPDDITVECSVDVDNTSITGVPSLTGPCGEIDGSSATYLDDISGLTDCGTGDFDRVWSIPLTTGGSSSCTQVITVENTETINISFPQDLTVDGCTDPDDLEPEDLSAPFDVPVITGDTSCNPLSIEYDDWPIQNDVDGCLELVRVWTIVETCIFDPSNPDAGGRYVHEQRIFINDDEAPTLNCPVGNVVVNVDDNSCVANVFINQVTILEECFPGGVVTNITSDLGDGQFFLDVPEGTYQVNYEATDACGNSDDCSYSIIVVDEAPDAQCLAPFTINLGNTGNATLSAAELDNGSTDNCTDEENLEFRIELGTPGGTVPATSVLGFICDDLGVNTTVTMWVGDASGNFSNCTTSVQIADPTDACTNNVASAIVAGLIQAPNGAMINEVEVSLNTPAMEPEMTDNAGHFMFEEVAMEGSYKLTAQRNSNFKDGISIADVIKTLQHITNKKLLESPYQQIAADVNGDGRVSIIDAINLQKVILNISTNLSTPAWRFVPGNYSFPNPQNAFSSPFPEYMDISNLKEDYMDADFIGIKTGDVNMSFEPVKNFNSVENRSDQSLPLSLDDIELEAGKRVLVPINVDENIGLLGFQFAMDINTSYAEVKNISSPLFGDGFLYKVEDKGQVLLSGVSERTLTQHEEEFLLIELEIKAKAKLSEVLKLNNSFEMEGILGDGTNSNQFIIDFQELSSLDLKVHPNPFSSEVNVWINSSFGENISYSIWNGSGQLIYQNSFQKDKGAVQLQLGNAALGTETGVFFLKVLSNTGTKIEKLIRQ